MLTTPVSRSTTIYERLFSIFCYHAENILSFFVFVPVFDSLVSGVGTRTVSSDVDLSKGISKIKFKILYGNIYCFKPTGI